MKYKTQRLKMPRARCGYVAIMSALIITAIIVVMMIGLGQVAYLNRANISEAHFKEKSRALSEACVNTALLKLVASSSYAGNETIAVASDTCKIVGVVSSSTGRIVTTQGQYQNSYTNLKITVATSTVLVIGWEETQN
jgi:hypothetical protein